MFCRNCGAQLEEGAIFCQECGTKQEEKIIDVVPSEIREMPDVTQEPEETLTETKEEDTTEPVAENTVDTETAGAANGLIPTENIRYCHNCGAANSERAEFCGNCGTVLSADSGPVYKSKKRLPKKKYVAAIIGVLLVAVVAVGVVKVVCSRNNAKTLVYLKDNEFTVSINNKQYTVGDDVYEDDDNAETISNYTSYIVQTSKDGKYLFYPQDYGYGEFSLYRKKLNGEKAEEIKVDSGVSGYTVLDNNDVVYIKSEKLYYSDLEEKRKIASEVSWFRVSANGKYIMWYTSDGDNRLYIQDIKGKKDYVKVDSDIDYIEAYSENFDRIVYVKDDHLYLVRDFEEKEKIASDVAEVCVQDIDGNLGIYYTIYEEEDSQFSLSDVIEDEYAVSDSQMVEPDIQDYQKTEMKESFWGLIESVTTDDAYYQELEKYQEKLARDDIRDALDESLGLETVTLYYYSDKSGGKESLLEGCFEDIEEEDGILLCYYFDEEAVDKVSMDSLISSDWVGIEYELTKCLLSGMKVYVYNGTEQTQLELDSEEYSVEWMDYEVDSESHMLYFVTSDVDEEETYLFATNYEKDKGKLELIAEDVNRISLVTSAGVYYLCDVDNGEGTLYLNGSRIDDDVAINSVTAFVDGEILYMTDVDSDYNVGTLYLADSKNKTRIADDVALYETNEKDQIAFLTDYNFKKYRGDLKLYKNNKTVSIDTDVATIIGFY